MDTFVAIASKRDTRRYAEDEVPAEVLERILEAGRVAGNAMNRQARRLVVLETVRERAAECVSRPGNLLGARAAVAIVDTGGGEWAGFDAGRVAQNMMLAAWNDGVASCPNTVTDHDALAELLGLAEGERAIAIVSFGYPVGRRDPERRSAEQWLARADRRPLAELASTV